ncbi:AMP-binding protein [Bacillus sp. V5-8f]|uniref:AMP-binding protein n=1 Tax=Bacillus sp. V5-8f TaxID=2053044 RepID=UPI001159C742
MNVKYHVTFIYYGILKAGGVVVPINFRLTSHKAGYIFYDSDAVIVFADDWFYSLNHKKILKQCRSC